MASTTTFEVYVLQGSRWEIHSRFPANKQDDAIADGKAQEKVKTVTGVKVVKETFDSDLGVSKESIVYKTPTLTPQMLRMNQAAAAPPPPTPAARSSSASSGGGARMRPNAQEPQWKEESSGGNDVPAEDDGEEFDDEGNPIKKKKKKAKKAKAPKGPKQRGKYGGFTKLGFITVVSVLIGAGGVALGNYVLNTRYFGNIPVGSETRANILFALFVTSFLFSILPMSWFFISIEDFAARAKAPRKVRPGAAPKAEALPKVEMPKAGVAPATLEDLLKDDEPLPEPEADLPEPEPEADAEPEPEPQEIVSPVIERQKVHMMKFLGDSLAKVKTAQKTLDSHGKFGVNLYMAGACEALNRKNELDDEVGKMVLADTVQVLGFKKELAVAFADKADSYLMQDSKYMQMYEMGRNAMNAVMEGDESGAGNLNGALTEWNKPKAKDAKSGPITVMFTDMVGSTALTQAKGDAAAQEVVRAHNRIVRDALQRFQGKEIKHTGDGIMCSFSQTSNGVEAAMTIMRGCRDFRATNPELPLHLKIGINAGEPIAEDDDLFGTTVQLSARITDKATAGQIFVSDIVRGMCAGKPLTFVNRGGFAMKGVSEPVVCYEAMWDETAAAAPAAAQAS